MMPRLRSFDRARARRCSAPRRRRSRAGSGTGPATEFQSWRIPGWTFTPGVTVGALYDTNVTLVVAAT